jgi:hypothetical protein
MKHRIDIKPLSVNDAWKGKRYKTDVYKQYSRDLTYLLPRNYTLPPPPYEIRLKWGFSSKLSDWDNPIKPTQDIYDEEKANGRTILNTDYLQTVGVKL